MGRIYQIAVIIKDLSIRDSCINSKTAKGIINE